MSLNKYDIARRFTALPADARQRFIDALKKNGIDFARLPIVPVARDGVLPLSLAQQRLWFLAQMAPDNAACHIPAMLRLDGRLDRDALQQALNTIVARHEVLRTTFCADEAGHAGQRIAPPAPVVIVHTDLTMLAGPAREAEALRLAESDTRTPFNLAIGPLLRTRLVTLADDAHLLILVQHHIVSDGWSVDLLIRELAEALRAHAEQREPVFAALPIQYADYAVWQRYWLDAGERERQLCWWREQLGENHPLLALPLDRPRQAVRDQAGARQVLQLDGAISDTLRGLARREGATLFMVLLAAFAAQLARHAGTRAVRVGVATAGRGRAETDPLPGFFVGTQVLAAHCEPQSSFLALLSQVKEWTLGAQAHADLPFDELVDALGVERSLSYNPLVQVKFTRQIALPDRIALPGLTLRPQSLPDHAARFDLSLDVTDRPEGIEAVFSWATALFDAATVERIAASWAQLLSRLAAAPDTPLAVLTRPADRAGFALVAERHDGPWPDVLSAWAASVQAHGTAPALCHEDQVLSFAELDAASNRLARYLQAGGVQAETRVGLIAERSNAFVLGLLAVLKAGGAYVPVDPGLPAARVACLLDDSHVHCVLADRPHAALAGAIPVVPLADDTAWHAVSAAPLSTRPLPGQVACVIYTSGSTGRPKGVVTGHGALVDYVSGMLARLNIAPGASMAMVSTVSADLGHTVLFGALCSGRLLHLISAERAFDPDHFAAYMAAHAVGVLKIVPSHLQGLLQAARPADVLPHAMLVLGGEALPQALAEDIATLRPMLRVINHYGPTEATVGALTQELILTEPVRSATVPIGAPLPNASAWVLDDALEAVPLGAVGELYLAGPGLARGYLGCAGLTAERFLPHPFALGERLYRTGDRVRMLPNGVIEYLGRVDDQVKIRGYRVELSEVANALLAQPGVAEAQVLTHDAGEGRLQLVAWLVAVAGASLDPAVLKAGLARALPDYMVPTWLIPLDRMPLTANGKLDRKALPLPTAVAPQAMPAERNQTEQALADIWCTVLHLDAVGLHDNFFELGGDSILSLQIIARARKAGLKLTPRQLFENQTVATLARVALPVVGATPAVLPALASAAAALPLTPVQQAFFAAAVTNRAHWNQALRFATGEPLDAGLLKQALAALLARHDALRLRFEQRAGEWVQSIAPVGPPAEVLWLQPADADVDKVCDAAQQSLDLANGPLLRAVLFGDATLFIVIHHLAVDGVSWRVLIDDLVLGYRQLASGQPVTLADVPTSWAAWAVRLAHHAGSGAFDAELPYWQRLAADGGLDPVCDVPKGRARVRDADQLTMVLDTDTTRQLLKHAPAAWRTRINELLLTALARALGRNGELLVELEGHGRESQDPGLDDVDLSRTVGWFASHFPVRLAAGGALPAAILSVKETLRAVPGKGMGFGVLKARGRAPARTLLAALPRPRVTFNYLGQFDGLSGGDALLTPLFGASGKERDAEGPLTNRLAIHGQVSAGKLAFVWIYSREQYQAATVATLAAAFERELVAIVTHCLAATGGISPSDFPLAGLDQPALAQLPVAPRELADLYPASPMQQGLLFHALLDPAGVTYVNQLTMTLTDPDIDRLAAAWQGAVDAHAILRTGFWHDGLAIPQQLVLRSATLAMGRHDLRGQPQPATQLAALADAERTRPFDLTVPPLMRVAVVRLTDTEYRLIWTRHHLLLDGWSTARLWAEVLRRYGGTEAAVAPGACYRDYIAWLGVQDAAPSRGFWQAQLAAIDEPTRLAGAFPPQSQDGPGQLMQHLSVAASETLRRFARTQRVTVNTVVQGAWVLLLQRYTGRQSVTFGSTIADRPSQLSGIEEVLGLFINTLPVVEAPRAAERVGDWLRGLQQRCAAAREHGHVPLFELQRWAGHGGQALFDSLIVFENYPVAPEWAGGTALQVADIVNVERTHYPLVLMVADGETLSVEYGYHRSAFSDAGIQRLNAHFLALLARLVANPAGALGQVALPSPAETDQLERWNATTRTWPDLRPVHRRFSAHARARPDRVALLFGAATLSYGELDTRANRLAHRLIRLGVQPDDRVAVCLARSFELVIALLAVLKAGAAYVPIDPDYPASRRAWMLEDAKPRLTLCTRKQLAEFPDGTPVLCVDQAQWQGEPDGAPDAGYHPEQLAYLMYTSGSTGRPKGAGNRHAALLNRLQWMQDAWCLDENDTVLQKTPFSFDVSVWEFFWPLMIGARLAIAPPGAHRDPARLAGVIQQHGVTTLHFVPSMLQAFVAEDVAGRCATLTRIVCSGEALPADLAARTLRLLPGAALYNLYGPTEAAIDVTHWTCVNDGAPAVPIGRPIANTQIHLLDADLNPLPVGVTGELYIGGAGLARGYHARPGLTAERFLPDPFTPGARLYRTGDLARWRDDGAIDILGRLDHQVKLRGLRIELGEIEAQLSAHPAVREAVVVAHGGERLIAYFVPERAIDNSALLRHLKNTLPEFMLPSQLVPLARMPLTPNGKLDRKALPEPMWAGVAFEAPQGETESLLATIWQNLLGVAGVGRHDNFFALGGHSLLATRVLSRLKAERAISLPLRSVFEAATLAELARIVDDAADSRLTGDKLDALDALLGEMETQ